MMRIPWVWWLVNSMMWKIMNTFYVYDNIDGLVQDCSISSMLAVEILQSCPKSSICDHLWTWNKSPIENMKKVWQLRLTECGDFLTAWCGKYYIDGLVQDSAIELPQSCVEPLKYLLCSWNVTSFVPKSVGSNFRWKYACFVITRVLECDYPVCYGKYHMSMG